MLLYRSTDLVDFSQNILQDIKAHCFRLVFNSSARVANHHCDLLSFWDHKTYTGTCYIIMLAHNFAVCLQLFGYFTHMIYVGDSFHSFLLDCSATEGPYCSTDIPTASISKRTTCKKSHIYEVSISWV